MNPTVLEDGPRERRPVRIVILESHVVVRDGLTALLGHRDDIEVVAAVADGREALKVVAAETPDVVVMEPATPSTGGMETIRRMSELPSPPRVVALSDYSTGDPVRPALEAGAHAFVSKRGASGLLIDAIHAVHEGRFFMCPIVADVLLRMMASPPSDVAPESTPTKLLTAREREVLGLIAQGQTDRQIAGLLSLSIKTVNSHRTRIMAKLGVRNVGMLVRRAIELRLIEV
jgi:two-component system response regulator NreC